MTLPTKILLAVLFASSGAAAFAKTGVTATTSESESFAPAPSRGPASIEATPMSDQSAIEDRGEIADNQTEGGTCEIQCHPAFNYSPKTALARFDLKKIK